MAIVIDLFVKSGSSPQLSADDATVQHQMALLLHGDYTKWAWLSFSAASPPIYSLSRRRSSVVCSTSVIRTQINVGPPKRATWGPAGWGRPQTPPLGVFGHRRLGTVPSSGYVKYSLLSPVTTAVKFHYVPTWPSWIRR